MTYKHSTMKEAETDFDAPLIGVGQGICIRVCKPETKWKGSYEMLNKSDVGQALRLFRLKAGLTQQELSAKFNGVSDGQSYISRVERGDANLTFETLIQLCAHLEVSASSLFATAEQIAADRAIPEEQLILECLELPELGLSEKMLAKVRSRVKEISKLRNSSKHPEKKATLRRPRITK